MKQVKSFVGACYRAKLDTPDALRLCAYGAYAFASPLFALQIRGDLRYRNEHVELGCTKSLALFYKNPVI